MNLTQHLAEARAHLLSAATDIEQYISGRGEGWAVATPVVAAHFGLDHARMTGTERLLMELAVDTAIDHQDAVKAALVKAKHYRKPSESPVTRARARA